MSTENLPAEATPAEDVPSMRTAQVELMLNNFRLLVGIVSVVISLIGWGFALAHSVTISTILLSIFIGMSVVQSMLSTLSMKIAVSPKDRRLAQQSAIIYGVLVVLITIYLSFVH